MSLYVDTENLPGLVDLLKRMADDALVGTDYVSKSTELSGGEGWLNQLSGAHGFVVDHTIDWLSELSDPGAQGPADAVRQAIDHYRTTDHDQAVRLDELIGPYGGLLDRPYPTSDYHIRHTHVGPFGDVADPEDSLLPIQDYNADEAFQYQPTWSDVISPASIGRDTIWYATDFLAQVGWLDRAYDPYDLVLKPVLGDWAGFRGSADVFRNLAAAVDAMGRNLYHAQATMPAAWRGNASDACSVHLGRMRTVFDEAQDPLRAVADRYEEAAHGQADFRTVAGQLIDDLIDAAIALAIAIAGGTASSWTGIGAVIGSLVGAWEASTIVRIILEFIDLYSRIDAVIAAVDSAMNDFGQLQAPDYYLPPMPQVTGGHSTLDALPS